MFLSVKKNGLIKRYKYIEHKDSISIQVESRYGN